MGPKVPVNGINEQVKSVEEATERSRMSANERKDLPITCTHCGRPFVRRQDLIRHENKHEGKCADRKRRMKASERTDLPFECEKCHNRFSRQQDLTRHKQHKCGTQSSSRDNQCMYVCAYVSSDDAARDHERTRGVCMRSRSHHGRHA